MDSVNAAIVRDLLVGAAVLETLYISFKLSHRKQIESYGLRKNVPTAFFVLPFPLDLGYYLNHMYNTSSLNYGKES